MDMNGMRDNFKDAVSHMLPVDPYTKSKKQSGKSVTIADAHALQNKSNSKTGVDLRWHKREDYSKLNIEQRKELYVWQQTKEGKKTTAKQKKDAGYEGKPAPKKRLQAKVAALEATIKKSEEASIDDKVSKAIVAAASAITSEDAPIQPTSEDPFTSKAATQLRALLKRKHEGRDP